MYLLPQIQMCDINGMSRGLPWSKTCATHYQAQIGLSDKGLVVCNGRNLEPFNLLNDLALGCYQPSPEICFV